MARPSKPWYRKDRDAWYAWIGGRQVLLARGKSAKPQAEKRFHQLHAASVEAPETVSVAVHTVLGISKLYLDFVRANWKQITYDQAQLYIRRFTPVYGHLPAIELTPHQLTTWYQSFPTWSSGTQWIACTVIKKMYRWAKRQGLIPTNPIADVERPKTKRRESIMTADQFRTIMAQIRDQPFRDLLTVLHETGCRPGEAFAVTAQEVNLDAGTWVLEGKTSGKTGRKRVVYLTQVAVEICRRLCAEHPTGPIFLNTWGRPWSNKLLHTRFRVIRRKLGYGHEVTAYSLRHLFVTDALVNEVPIATVAELVGHTSTAMISKVYSHLSERAQHLREAAERVRSRDRTSTPPESTVEPSAPAEQPAAPAGDGPGKTRRRKS